MPSLRRVRTILVVAAIAGPLGSRAPAHDGLSVARDEITARISGDGDATGDLRLDRAGLAVLDRDWASALSDLRSVAEERPDHPELPAGWARFHLARSHPDLAAGATANLRDEAGPYGWRLRADALAQLDDYDGAVTAWRVAMTRAGIASPDDYAGLADLLTRAGRPEAALAALDAGIARLPGAVSLQLLAVEQECSLRRYAAARARLAGLADDAARPEPYWIRRAEIFLVEGLHDDARIELTRARDSLRRLPRRQRARPMIARQLEAVDAMLSTLESSDSGG